jgi:ATP synthase F1 complex assembly factor 2
VEKFDPLIGWIKSEFGFKPVVHSCLFGGKQEEGLVKAIENLLKQTDDCQLAVIDAIASAAHSLIIAVGIVKGKLDIEEAIELIRLEEDFQVLVLSLLFTLPSFLTQRKTLEKLYGFLPVFCFAG